jgi:type IV pilus assembly protein PilX
MPTLAPSRQRGVVLIYALIALVIMMIGAVAISRSMNNAQFNVGNIGFKRDLANQGDLALQRAMDAVRGSNALASITVRNNNLKAANYSAILLASNAQGIPNALISDSDFASVGLSSNDIQVNDTTRIRYVVDRMALATGNCSPATCTMVNQSLLSGASSNWNNSQNNSGAAGNQSPGAVPPQATYRLTVRVSGPRNTLSFFQSTFTTD